MAFSIGGAINEAWGLTKKHFGFLWAGIAWSAAGGILVVAAMIAHEIPRMQAQVAEAQRLHRPLQPGSIGEPLWLQAGAMLLYLLILPLFAGLFTSLLRIVRGGKPVWRDLLGRWDLFWPIFGTMLIYLAGELLLFAVPPYWFPVMLAKMAVLFYACMAFSQTPLVIVDTELGVIDAFRRSWELTRGCRGKLFLFHLALMGINFAGELCLLVGLLATVPLTVLSFAVAYEKLRLRADGAQAPLSPPVPAP